MTRKTRKKERRKFKRLDIIVPVSVQLLREAGCPPAINTETENISPDGLSIVVKIRQEDGRFSREAEETLIKLIPYLVLDHRVVILGVKILPKGGEIKMRGRVTWCDRGLRGEFYSLRAGISIEEIEREHYVKWLEFVRTIVQLQDEDLASIKS